MRPRLSILLVALAVFGTQVQAQTVRQKNPVALKRPDPLIVARGQPRELLQAIEQIIRQHHFVSVIVGYYFARRSDGPPQQNTPESRPPSSPDT